MHVRDQSWYFRLEYKSDPGAGLARRRTHLARVFATEARSRADHVVGDPEPVVVLAIADVLHVHDPQHGRQELVVHPRQPPAADRAHGAAAQLRRVGGRHDDGLDHGVQFGGPVELRAHRTDAS